MKRHQRDLVGVRFFTFSVQQTKNREYWRLTVLRVKSGPSVMSKTLLLTINTFKRFVDELKTD